MAELGAIVGESGSGKSTSIRNLDPTKTFIVNVARKALPFRGSKKNYKEIVMNPETNKYEGNLYNTSSVDKIAQVLKVVDKTMPHIKYVIIDDKKQ